MTACDKLRSTALSTLIFVLPAIASAQEACTTYSVKDGDTLGTIAQAAYGSYDYQMIFNANRDALAANPNNLPAGLQLILPCEDGRLTADSEVGSVIEQQTRHRKAARRATSTNRRSSS
jgi:phage tail protein X